MALRVRAALAAFLSPQGDELHHVHFHNGPQGQPVPCFEVRCRNPRLDVE